MQFHSLGSAHATRAEEHVELPDAPKSIAVGITCEDHEPVAAEHKNRKASEGPGDIVLVDAHFVSVNRVIIRTAVVSNEAAVSQR